MASQSAALRHMLQVLEALVTTGSPDQRGRRQPGPAPVMSRPSPPPSPGDVGGLWKHWTWATDPQPQPQTGAIPAQTPIRQPNYPEGLKCPFQGDLEPSAGNLPGGSSGATRRRSPGKVPAGNWPN